MVGEFSILIAIVILGGAFRRLGFAGFFWL
jgi:hypothetical protein